MVHGTEKLKDEVGKGLSLRKWSISFGSMGDASSMPLGGSARNMLSA